MYGIHATIHFYYTTTITTSTPPQRDSREGVIQLRDTYIDDPSPRPVYDFIGKGSITCENTVSDLNMIRIGDLGRALILIRKVAQVFVAATPRILYVTEYSYGPKVS